MKVVKKEVKKDLIKTKDSPNKANIESRTAMFSMTATSDAIKSFKLVHEKESIYHDVHLHIDDYEYLFNLSDISRFKKKVKK